MDLKINKEFKDLIPPLSQDEYNNLEKSILDEGCRDALIVWDEVIVDGHNRYEICKNHNIDFETFQKDFSSVEDAKVWMIDNQKGRRNLSDYVKHELAQLKRKILLEKGRENLKTNVGGSHMGLSNIDKGTSHNTQQEIAKDLGWSTGKVAMADKVRKEVEENNEEELKQKLRNNEISISKAYKQLKEKRKEEFKKKRDEKIEKKAKEPLTEEESILLERIKRGETVVVNINKHFACLKYARDNGIYKQIDRYSEFGNPFFLDTDGDRDHVCDAYARYFSDKKSLHNKVKDLKGKVLGCHCAPKRCHGDHLKKLADEA